MTALPNVPQTVKQRLHWDVGTDANAVTILHWRYTGTAPTNADCTTWCAAFNALTAADWPLYLDSETTYLGTDIVDLTAPTSAGGASNTSVVGTRATTPMGAGTAVLVTYPIGRRYRGGKPRTYLPWGTAEDLATRNTFSSGAVTAFHTGWSTILNAIGASFPLGSATFLDFVSLSYYGPPNKFVTGSTGRIKTISTPRTAALIDPWSNFNVSDKVASQRRRNLQR